MALKRWAVRQISGLLSDYLEGITEQNLQATLSLEVGEIEIRHVRVQRGLLAEQFLDLLSSDVSVSARIPWRSLGSEPTVITVRDVWAEVHAVSPSLRPRSPAEEAEALRRWRAGRRRKVQARLDAAAAAAAEAGGEGGQQRRPRSVAARLGHALLRQLQVRVEGLRVRIHAERDDAPPLDLFCTRLALDEGAAIDGDGGGHGVAEVPPEIRRHPATLDKVLELVGLSAEFGALPAAGLARQRWDDLALGGLRERLAERQRALEQARGGGEAWMALQRELAETKAQLRGRAVAGLPVLGPLSLDARLWHSLADALLWLCAQLRIERGAAAVSLSPLVAVHLAAGAAWCSAALFAPPRLPCRDSVGNAQRAEELPSGPQYVELCTRRLRGDLGPEDCAVLEEIEDVAPIEWLVRWQRRLEEPPAGAEPQAPPRVGAGVSASGVPGTAPVARTGLVGWLRSRLSGGEGAASSEPMGAEVSSDSEVDSDADAIDDDLGVQEVEEPKRMEVRCVIPTCTIVACSLDAGAAVGGLASGVGPLAAGNGVLRLEAGVDCRAAFATATAGSVMALRQAAWDADVQANLTSIAVRLDEEPLMLLQRTSGLGGGGSGSAGASAPSDPMGRGEVNDEEAEFFDALSDEDDDVDVGASGLPRGQDRSPFGDGEGAPSSPSGSSSRRTAARDSGDEVEEVAAMRLAIHCACHGGAAASAVVAPGVAVGGGAPPTWAIRVRLKQEPLRFSLAPHSSHDALAIIVTMARSLLAARPRRSRPAAALPPPRQDGSSVPATPRAGSAPTGSGCSGGGGGTGAAGEAVAACQAESDAAASVALDVDLDVAAPTLRWGLLPKGHVTLALGRLLFRTCSVAPPPKMLAAAQRCSWKGFACLCQLTETRAAVEAEDTGECQVYDPSTIFLRAWRETEDGSAWQISVDAEALTWTLSPTVLNAFGQLPLSFDYAISPLRGLLMDAWSAPGQAVGLAENALAGEDFGVANGAAPESPDAGGEGLAFSTPCSEPPDSGSASPCPPPSSSVRVCVNVCLRRAELVCGRPDSPQASLVFKGAAAEYTTFSGRSDVLTKVAHFDLAYDGSHILSCSEGGFVRVASADQRLDVSGGSALIEVQWRERSIRRVVALVLESFDCLGVGRDGAKVLLPVGDSAGMFAQLGGRYVIRPIQARVQKKVASRIAELLPGPGPGQPPSPQHSKDARVFAEDRTACAAGVAAAEVTPRQHRGPPLPPPPPATQPAPAADHARDAAAAVAAAAAATEAEVLPSPRGLLSVEVRFTYAGLTAVFVSAEQEDEDHDAVGAQVAVTGADFGFRGYRSGDIAAEMSLQNLDVSLLGRRLLAPRRKGKLLEVAILRRSGRNRATFWTASWAQVCILFRQRDYDFLSAFVRASVLGALHARRRASVSVPPPAPALRSSTLEDVNQNLAPPVPGNLSRRASEPSGSSAAAPSPAAPAAAPARFRLDIGAPLVFLPTDGTSLIPPRKPQERPDGRAPERGSGGQLEIIDASTGEPGFRPEPCEGVLVFDFGHVAACGGGEGGAHGQTGLQLRGARVLGATALPDRPGKVQEILGPLTWAALLRIGTGGPVEFHAVSIGAEDGGECVTHRLALTRARLTLILDVLAENVCYGGRSAATTAAAAAAQAAAAVVAAASAAPAPAMERDVSSMSGASVAGAGGQRRVGRGFRFSWTWPGELVFDIAFTDNAPIGRLRLRSGTFSIDTSPKGSKYDIHCVGLSAEDLRKQSRNVVKRFLEIADRPSEGGAGFGVYVNFPADADGKTVVQVSRPVMHILPQLVMDLICAGLSAWQHCTFRNDRLERQQALPTAAVANSPAQIAAGSLGATASAAAAGPTSPRLRPATSPQLRPATSSMSLESGCSQLTETRRGTRIQVNLLDGAFRIPERWDLPDEHFEFAGSLVIAILCHAEGIRIERFDLESGALRLRTSRRGGVGAADGAAGVDAAAGGPTTAASAAPARAAATTTTLCPCLEWNVRGEQRRRDDGARMKRQTNYELRSVILPPYEIRMSARDHQAMVRALMNLISLDAETAEPPEETRSRDPLAVNLVENRMTLVAEVAVQGAEVQILGEDGGHEWPGLKANARCPLFEVTVQTRQGFAPTINLFTKGLEFDLWAHNHRLGVWEPVLPACVWRVSYHRQRRPDGGPLELMVRGDVAAASPVRLVVSASFIHLASSIFRDSGGEVRYGHLLAGLNISGIACRIAIDGGEQRLLRAECRMQPLDELFRGVAATSSYSRPGLTLTIEDHPDAKPCYVPLGREVCIPWDTKAVGLLVCRLVMPRPPQHVLLISSTVCVWNRTPTDLEVRFLAPRGGGTDLQPLRPGHACRTVDAFRVMTGMQEGPSGEAAEDREQAESEAAPVATSPSLPPEVDDDGVLRLAAGKMLSAPTEAQLRVGQVVFQLRPAPDSSGGITYEWSDSFFSVPTGTPDVGAVTVCSPPPPAMQDSLPRHRLHLRACCSHADEGWCVVEAQAPFTIVNACPCDIYCRLNPLVNRTSLGTERDRFSIELGTSLDLAVGDGRGSEVRVPQGGQAEILPLRLDADGYFHWTCSGRRGRTKAKRNTNCLIAVLDARRGEIVWHFFQAVMDSEVDRVSIAAPIRIAPGGVLPAFDLVAEDVGVSFAMRDTEGVMTGWSFPTQAVNATRSSEEVIELVHRGMYVSLSASRQGRELIVYARWWFVNSTGLPVRLMQPGGPGKMHPVWAFGDDPLAFLPQVGNDAGDGVANVELRGEAPVEVRVPDVGGAQALQLTPLHTCCLRTERVALPEAMRGVPCCVVTLLPALLLFNRLGSDLEIGFRQVGCSNDTATWVPTGASGALWWASRAEQVVQVAVRRRTSSEINQTSWSPPFEIKESRIGAYPLALKSGHSQPFLICLTIDQDTACVLSVTVAGRRACHAVVNKHPGLTVEASFDGAPDDVTFPVPHGERVPVAGRVPPGGGVALLRLWLRSVGNPEERALVGVPLARTGMFNVPLSAGPSQPAASGGSAGASASASAARRGGEASTPSKRRLSTLRTPSVINVELCNRVAIVTIAPGAASAADSEGETPEALRTLQGELRVEHMSIALITDWGPSTSSAATALGGGVATFAPTVSPTSAAAARRPREAFTVSLAGVCVDVKQTPTRSRDVDFKISDFQVDLQTPYRDVVLRSTTRPFLRMQSQRDDVRTLDLHLKHIKFDIGDLEVSVTGAALEQVRRLRRTLMPGTVGLPLKEVLARAHVPYHVNRRHLPPASSKLVVSSLVVSQAKVDVWCRLYLPDAHYVPKTLRDTLQVVSLYSHHLDVKGAQVKLPAQTLFTERSPGEGSLSAVLARVSDHYLPHVKSCWRSLLQHSNIFLGGYLSRHTWAPRQRRAWVPGPPMCSIGPSGELEVHNPHEPPSVYGIPLADRRAELVRARELT